MLHSQSPTKQAEQDVTAATFFNKGISFTTQAKNEIRHLEMVRMDYSRY